MLLDIEVDPERLEKSIEAEYRKFATRARVPGFRPGKAPRAAIERHVGGAKQLRAGLIDDAIQKLVPAAYNDAIAENEVDAIDQPELEIVEIDPVRFKATVPVRPSVDLGDYTSIRVEKEPVEVTPEMVEEQIMLLRRRHATQAPVERGAEWDDFLIASVKGTLKLEADAEEGAEPEEILDDEDAEFPLREGQPLIVEGLAEAFLGMKSGDTKTLDLTFPEDFRMERYQGKDATFTIGVKEVKEEQLPEADDEFAVMVSPDEFESFEQLRAKIESSLQESMQQNADNSFRQKALDLLVEGATLEYPKVMVEREIDHIIKDSTGNDTAQYARYLQSIGRSEADFREGFREGAEARVKRSLVLSKLSEVEALEVHPDDISTEIEKLIEPMGEDGQRFREMFLSEAGQATVSRDLISRKTIERLVEIASNPEPAPERPAADVESPSDDATDSKDVDGEPSAPSATEEESE
ncbi:hypothetical protein AYO38_02565 [bacterium SCGC AG-212-C10]|nr:hypothetical protein AYO38_02565 [bacterium SCGC AG-212-C10]